MTRSLAVARVASTARQIATTRTLATARFLIDWLPTQLGGIQLWVDAADTATLFQDSGGTTPIVADIQAAYWGDKSGNNRNAIQLTAANCPFYRVGVLNSKPVLRFDGINDNLEVPHFSLINGDYTIVSVVASATTGAWFGQGSTSSVTPFMALLHVSTSINRFAQRSDTSQEVAGGAFDKAATNGRFVISVMRRNGTSWLNRVNKSDATSVSTVGTSTVNRTHMGARQAAGALGSLFNGDLAELLVYNTSLPDASVLMLEAYLNAKWGVL